MDGKEWLGLLALVVTTIQYGPYCWSTFKRKIRPHAFSYLIWGVSAGVVFVAQYIDKGGAGSWSMAYSTLACLLVCALSARAGMGYITRNDWITLAVALTSIPLWVITKNPLSAVIVITFVDTLAYVPTLHKAYSHPFEDSPRQYAIGGVKHFLSLLALQNFDLTTALAPVSIVVANSVVILLLLWRRAVLARQ